MSTVFFADKITPNVLVHIDENVQLAVSRIKFVLF